MARRDRQGPAPGLRGDLLLRALAQALQEQAFGGLSIATRKRIDVIAARSQDATETAATRQAPQKRRLMPGTQLVREWQGVVHQVIVMPDGFLWQGQTYASLSTVAKAITGTAGPSSVPSQVRSRLVVCNRLAPSSIIHDHPEA